MTKIQTIPTRATPAPGWVRLVCRAIHPQTSEACVDLLPPPEPPVYIPRQHGRTPSRPFPLAAHPIQVSHE